MGNSLFDDSMESGYRVWLAVFGDDDFNVRRKIEYKVFMCGTDKLRGMNWKVPVSLATLKFTIIIACDGSAPTLKSSPIASGDWRLKQEGWYRTDGKKARSEGNPMPMLGE